MPRRNVRNPYAQVREPARHKRAVYEAESSLTFPDISPVYIDRATPYNNLEPYEFFQKYQANKNKFLSNKVSREHVSVHGGKSCNLNRYQCIGSTRKGSRCSRFIAAGLPFCFQHVLSNYKIKIARTTLCTRSNGGACRPLPMLGLFACGENFKQNDAICPYLGERMTRHQIDTVYPGKTIAPYAINFSAIQGGRGPFVDALCERSSAAYANAVLRQNMNQYSAGDSQRLQTMPGYDYLAKQIVGGVNPRPNAKLSTVVHKNDVSKKSVWLVATRPIPSGQEIFVDFKDYSMPDNPNDVQSRHTNLKRTTCKKK